MPLIITTVTVYTVVDVGITHGLATCGLLNPVVGNQEYDILVHPLPQLLVTVGLPPI